MPSHFVSEARSADLAVVATAKGYENNFFYDADDASIVLVSFANWKSLTNLPIANGYVLFVAELIGESIRLGTSHSSSRGCLNDFRQMKTDIDFAMRAAFVCQQCIHDFEASRPTTSDREISKKIITLLDDLCHASRANADIVDYWKSRMDGTALRRFDVFLCHNSADKEEVRTISSRLKAEGLLPWLDEEQLRPGARWQRVLQEQISAVQTAAVLVGSTGIGPWQDIEIEGILAELVRRGCPVIPVALATCPSVPDLPLFLRQLMWVDFRKDHPDPWLQMLWGITGKRP